MYKIEELKILRLLPDELQVILWKKYKDYYSCLAATSVAILIISSCLKLKIIKGAR